MHTFFVVRRSALLTPLRTNTESMARGAGEL